MRQTAICSHVGPNVAMLLKLRPSGLGSGIDEDRADFSRRVVGVNFPFRVLSGRTRVRGYAVRGSVRLGSVASFTHPH